MRRRLENQASLAATCGENACERLDRFSQGVPRLGASRIEIEQVLVDGSVRRKGHPQVGSRSAQRADRKLVLLRDIRMQRHIVHRPAGGEQRAQEPRHPAPRQQRVVRGEAIVVRRKGELSVRGQQLVQPGRSGSPVADDEQRRSDLRFGQGAAKDEGLGRGEQRVDRRATGDQARHRQAGRVDVEAVAGQQPQVGSQPHAVPESRRPERVAVGLERVGHDAAAEMEGKRYLRDCPDFCGRRPQKWDCPFPMGPMGLSLSGTVPFRRPMQADYTCRARLPSDSLSGAAAALRARRRSVTMTGSCLSVRAAGPAAILFLHPV